MAGRVNKCLSIMDLEIWILSQFHHHWPLNCRKVNKKSNSFSEIFLSFSIHFLYFSWAFLLTFRYRWQNFHCGFDSGRLCRFLEKDRLGVEFKSLISTDKIFNLEFASSLVFVLILVKKMAGKWQPSSRVRSCVSSPFSNALQF